jgi:hypothetical protein
MASVATLNRMRIWQAGRQDILKIRRFGLIRVTVKRLLLFGTRVRKSLFEHTDFLETENEGSESERFLFLGLMARKSRNYSRTGAWNRGKRKNKSGNLQPHIERHWQVEGSGQESWRSFLVSSVVDVPLPSSPAWNGS